MREQRDRTHLDILLFLQRTYILNDSHIIELYLISALINKLPQLEKRSVVVHVQMVSILLKKLSTYIRSKKCKLMLPHIGINEHCLIGSCIRWKCIYTCEQWRTESVTLKRIVAKSNRMLHLSFKSMSL